MKMKNTSNKDDLDFLKGQQGRSHQDAREADHQPIQATVQIGILVATAPISEWVVEIKKACTRNTAGTIDLAGVVAAAKRQSLLCHGQWKQICKSLPFSRRKADMLATIGEKFATLEEAAFQDLPSASTTLY